MQIEKNIDVITIAGTRPEIIKVSEFVQRLENNNHALLYTGQHYSDNMKDIFFDELKIKADYDLKCETSEVKVLKDEVVKFLKTVNPEYVIVYGDTYSTMAGALAAKEIKCKLIHLEAGVRDLDLTVPEERVRIYIDSVADHLIAPTDLNKMFLRYEGIENNVFVTGNLIVDVCKRMYEVAERYRREDLPSEYILLTLHRAENVDDPSKLEMLRKHLGGLRYKIVFPIHPRTKKNLAKYDIKLPSNVIALEPAGYLEFLSMLKNCKLVMTDSGGVTEEAVILRKPCITLRHTTARWETILMKANILFALDRKDSLNDVIETMLQAKITHHPYGENVAEKTVEIINKILSGT